MRKCKSEPRCHLPPLLPDLPSPSFAITQGCGAVSLFSMSLSPAGVSGLPTELVFSSLYSGALPCPRDSLIMFGLLEITLVGKCFLRKEFCQVGPCILLGVSPKAQNSRYTQHVRPGAAVKDWSPRVSSYYSFSPHHCLAVLTGTTFQTFVSLFVLSYEMGILGIKRGTGLKMLSRGDMRSLSSLVAKGSKFEYYFSIFGIHITITLGSIFVTLNSTQFSHFLFTKYIWVAVGWGRGHSE